MNLPVDQNRDLKQKLIIPKMNIYNEYQNYLQSDVIE